jgi:hypothetical protein
MSLSYRTEVYERPRENAERNHGGFVLVLVCVGLLLVVANAIFPIAAPANIGSGNGNDAWLVGP